MKSADVGQVGFSAGGVDGGWRMRRGRRGSPVHHSFGQNEEAEGFSGDAEAA